MIHHVRGRDRNKSEPVHEKSSFPKDWEEYTTKSRQRQAVLILLSENFANEMLFFAVHGMPAGEKLIFETGSAAAGMKIMNHAKHTSQPI